MDLGLDDRSVLVTAGTSGLGLGAARACAREGADVTVCSRTRENRERAADMLSDLGDGTVTTVAADITDRSDIERAVETAVAETGGLDHVVTSAGGVPPGTIAELGDDDWADAVDLLLMSLVWTLNASQPHLRDSTGGSLVAITSTSVREPIAGLALSNVVRRSVIGLIKTAARELAPEVRANAVLPGPFDTPRIQNLIEADLADEEYETREAAQAAWTSDVPLGRLGDPIELGDTIAYLLSDRASFVTGTAIPVDGGRLRS